MKILKSSIAVIALCASSISMAQHAENAYAFPVQVNVEQGIIEGEFDVRNNIQSFKGVPFAKPPVGELRWKAPQAPDKWSGVRQTKKFGPRAVQPALFGDMGFRSDGMSEDCLYLNVWSPAKSNDEKLPVLVYFYGGGFAAGDGSEYRYDGENMAKKGIVTVTVNYRLNIFGFFSHPELSKESPYKGSGNYGLLDQNAALKWVQANIAKFGGDPKRVTIAGESAGSASVSAQMASPLSKNLIAGAIGESGSLLTATPLVDAEKLGVDFATKAGAKSLKDLRALSTFELYQKYRAQNAGFRTTLDGYFFPKTFTEIFESKQQAMVPLMLGWNSEEMNYRALMAGKELNNENYSQRVKELYSTKADEVLKLYPAGAPEVTEQSATDLAGDRFIGFSTWKWFDLHRKNSEQPVYRYYYAQPRPDMRESDLEAGLAGGVIKKDKNAPKAPKPKGAVHSAEIEYAMGNLATNKVYAWTEDDYKVSETMMNYFANFIKTGNPNGEKLPNWPAAKNEENPEVLIINANTKAVRSENEARYFFLDKDFLKK